MGEPPLERHARLMMESLGKRFGVRVVLDRSLERGAVYNPIRKVIRYNPGRIIRDSGGDPNYVIYIFFHELAHKEQFERCPNLVRKIRNTHAVLRRWGLSVDLISTMIEALFHAQLDGNFFGDMLPDEYKETCLRIRRRVLEEEYSFFNLVARLYTVIVLESPRDRELFLSNAIIDLTSYGLPLGREEEMDKLIRERFPRFYGFYEDWKNILREAMSSKDPCIIESLLDKLKDIILKHNIHRYIREGM